MNAQSPPQRIFLIGPPASGKTTVAQELARLTGWEAFDTDKLIEKSEGRSVREIFESEGEEYFRGLERSLLDALDALDATDAQQQTKSDTGSIYATGGGFPVYNNNLERMNRLGYVVGLSAELDALTARAAANSDRPLLGWSNGDVDNMRSRIAKLIQERAGCYQLARYKIDTSKISPQEVAVEIVRMLGIQTDSL